MADKHAWLRTRAEQRLLRSVSFPGGHVEAIQDEDEEQALCGFCGGPLVELGVLGRYMHTRCRDCGTEFREVKPR